MVQSWYGGWNIWVYTESAWESHTVLLYEWQQNFETRREWCKLLKKARTANPSATTVPAVGQWQMSFLWKDSNNKETTMSFKALYFWQLLEKTRWTNWMDSSSSKKLTCKTWGKSWRSLKIFVSVKHMKRMNRTSFISDVKNHQKQPKRTSPLGANWQRTVTLEFSRTEWYEIKQQDKQEAFWSREDKNRCHRSVPSDTDNRTHRNEAGFVRCRQSSRATSGQTSDRGSPSARKSEHTTVSRRLWPKQCQEWVSKVVQRSWKAEINIQNHDGEPCKAIFYCNSSSIAAANETESGGRTETYGGGRRHTPRQKSDWVVRTHCGGAQVKWQSENLRRSHKTQRERSTWELPPSLYWSTSCTTLRCQSVQQTWLQQRILSNPIAWRVSGTDYIHHAIQAILFQTTSFWNQFQAWSLPQGNDSYPVRSARSYCPHQWKKSARTRRATAISIGKNARSRRHTQWEVRLFSWYHQVPRPHHFTGGNQSGFGQGWSHHQPPKTDQHSGVATTVRNGEPHWQIRTKSGWHHQASPWSPQERELVDLGHSTRDSISNTQETAEYCASVGTLQSWKGNKRVCRCIIIWTRWSPTPERTDKIGGQSFMRPDRWQTRSKGTPRWRRKRSQSPGAVRNSQNFWLDWKYSRLKWFTSRC